MEFILYGKMFNPVKAIKDRMNEKYGVNLKITTNPERIKRGDRVIRYGCTLPHNGTDIGINSVDFIKSVSNKLNFNLLGEVEDIEYYSPTFKTSVPDLEEFPIVLRTILNGYGGEGIILCRNIEEFNANNTGRFYWSRFIHIDTEYRVHLLGGKIAKIFKKVRDENLEEEEYPIRNNSRGYHFSVCNEEKFSKLSKVIENIDFTSNSFGALDIGFIKPNTFFILEFNCAPGLNNPDTLEKYVDFLYQKLYG